MQAVPSEVLQEQLEQLQQQHDQFRAEAQQSLQAKDDLVQRLQQQNEQFMQHTDGQVTLSCSHIHLFMEQEVYAVPNTLLTYISHQKHLLWCNLCHTKKPSATCRDCLAFAYVSLHV